MSVVAMLPNSPALPAYWLFAVVGVGLAIIDVRCQRLPYVLSGTLLIMNVSAFSVTAASAGDVSPLLRAVVAGVATATAMLMIALLLPGQLGLGDVVLAGVIATSLGPLGWQAVLHGVVSGFVAQAVVTLALRSRRRDAYPMGPALIAGWLTAILLHSM
uniref:prepilin peptidase n=1 Tax=Paractinoplanes polyasparticus TaxID=2856853 RepID=UPI0027DF16FF|nr:prepilin peptidase [Actinoplanes polyasparticus]